ncbi:MAG: UbiA family prenyltransferase [Halobacteriota archaeon]
MANTKVSASDVLMLKMAPAERSFRNKIVGLIALTGLGLDVLVLPFVIGTAALSGASFNDLRLLPLLFVVFIAAGVANITNDIIDAERDKTKWPLKPLSTGLISKSEAVLYAAILSAIGIVIAIVFFNWLLLTLGLLVLVGDLVYSLYMRDNIGYLTVILPFVLVPVGVWSAFSPETVLTPLPWLLALFLIAYQPAIQITHEGLDPNIPALFIRPRPTTERALYVASVIAVFFVGIAILLYAQLSWLFAVVLAVWTVVLLTLAKNLGENRSREKLETSFKVTMAGNFIYWLGIAIFVWMK